MATALSRRSFLTSFAAAAAAAPARPHLILFLADDHGWDIAGCYGNTTVKTPHLDRFARQGLRFTKAFAASPTCSPSRACLYTGLHSARNGLMGNHTGSKPGTRSIAQYLRELGYRNPQRLAQAMGGTLDASVAPGQDTVFNLWLPRA